MNRLTRSRRNIVRQAAFETLECRQLLHAPVLDAIPNQTVPAGKSIQVPLLATDSENNRVNYSVSDDSGAITTTLRAATNSWLRLTTNHGVMELQLFDDLAPQTVAHIKGLVFSGLYDGLGFHRVIENFMIQGGDPNGDGTGGPGFRFQDEFNPSVIFSNKGQLAMANSGKDTNGSQFFITAGATRHLDFNHTIYGQLVRGVAVFDAIRAVATDGNDRPTTAVTITNAEIVENKTDAVLQINAQSGANGTVTVTATNEHGESHVRTFTATAAADSTNSPPILQPIGNKTTARNTAITIPIAATDLEGDDYELGAVWVEQNGATGTFDGKNVVVTPAPDFSGRIIIRVGIKAVGANSRGSTQPNASDGLAIYDTETITIGVGEKALSGDGRGTDAANGTGTPNMVVATFRSADSGLDAGHWSVQASDVDAGNNRTGGINWGDGTFTDGTVIKNADGTYSVLGSHAYANPGTYPIVVTVEGNKGATLVLNSTATVRAMASLAGGVLTVHSSSGDDVVGLAVKNGEMRVNVNGIIQKFNPASVGRVEIYTYAGPDHVTLGGGIPGTYVLGGEGDDTLVGGAGNDTLTGGAGRDRLFGGDGDDRLNGSGGHDFLFGEAGNDRLYGNNGNDVLDGGLGVDRLFGGDGDDILIGWKSNDKLYGEAGNDTLIGGDGRDILNGGPGTDTARGVDDDETPVSVEVLE